MIRAQGISDTVVFTGARILSMDSAAPSPSAICISDGKIVDVGDGGVLQKFPGVEVRDLAGRTLLPGFIDAHNHLSVAALDAIAADLSGIDSVDEAMLQIREHAREFPHERFIRAVGWNDRLFKIHRRDLDALALERPVAVWSFSLHSCVVDSAALELLQIGHSTPDPPGGVVGRGREGRPNGLLFERAWSGAFAVTNPGPDDTARWMDLVEAHARTLISLGITAVHDTACSPDAERLYEDMDATARLPISVLMCPHPTRLLDRLSTDRLDGAPTGEGTETLRVGPIKLFADGAQLHSACRTSMGQEIVEWGLTMPGLSEDLGSASTQGFDVAIHAIGNVAVENALEAIEAARRDGAESQFRIEHCGALHPDIVRRMASLDVTAVVQPGFVEETAVLTHDLPPMDFTWLAFRTLKEAGVHLAASSDSPCAPVDPISNAKLGESRRASSGEVVAPEESLSFEDWLSAYTREAAAAGGQLAERGTITPGKRADLVILEGDIATRDVRVAETWIGGERVFLR